MLFHELHNAEIFVILSINLAEQLPGCFGNSTSQRMAPSREGGLIT